MEINEMHYSGGHLEMPISQTIDISIDPGIIILTLTINENVKRLPMG